MVAVVATGGTWMTWVGVIGAYIAAFSVKTVLSAKCAVVEVVLTFVDILASLWCVGAEWNVISAVLEVTVAEVSNTTDTVVTLFVAVVRLAEGTWITLGSGTLSLWVWVGLAGVATNSIVTHLLVGTQVHHGVFAFIDINATVHDVIVESNWASTECGQLVGTDWAWGTDAQADQCIWIGGSITKAVWIFLILSSTFIGADVVFTEFAISAAAVVCGTLVDVNTGPASSIQLISSWCAIACVVILVYSDNTAGSIWTTFVVSWVADSMWISGVVTVEWTRCVNANSIWYSGTDGWVNTFVIVNAWSLVSSVGVSR
jgi:hypothetical protein